MTHEMVEVSHVHHQTITADWTRFRNVPCAASSLRLREDPDDSNFWSICFAEWDLHVRVHRHCCEHFAVRLNKIKLDQESLRNARLLLRRPASKFTLTYDVKDKSFLPHRPFMQVTFSVRFDSGDVLSLRNRYVRVYEHRFTLRRNNVPVFAGVI